MPHERDYLIDILDSASLVLRYVGAMSQDDFVNSDAVKDAVLYRFTVIGEAANRVSDATRIALPQFPWRLMRGMRNIVVHQYDDVQFDTVYQTVVHDLPSLIESLTALLSGPWPFDADDEDEEGGAADQESTA